ncbi:MAG: hypothetical protein LC723_08125 [Actinobacteria bacterium]|nr:hypothetical protein [Actinomycetota bacterium]
MPPAEVAGDEPSSIVPDENTVSWGGKKGSLRIFGNDLDLADRGYSIDAILQVPESVTYKLPVSSKAGQFGFTILRSLVPDE